MIYDLYIIYMFAVLFCMWPETQVMPGVYEVC